MGHGERSRKLMGNGGGQEARLLDDLTYRTAWQDVSVERYSGYLPNMTDYHMHTYYEVSLILAGRVSVLLPGKMDSGSHARAVLLRPYTMHYIVPEPEEEYRRVNVLFTREFLEGSLPEWEELLAVFPPDGAVLGFEDDGMSRRLLSEAERLGREDDPFRRRLCLLYFLSLLRELSGTASKATHTPGYLSEVLSYLAAHYADKVVAADLAVRFGVSRTRLMTGIRTYTGLTFSDYLARVRLRAAMRMLREGSTEQEAAEACGFVSSCNFIRVFRKYFGETPRRYRGM